MPVFLVVSCPLTRRQHSLVGSPYGLVAHGVPQVNPENDGPLWQFDLTCVGKPSGKMQWGNSVEKLSGKTQSENHTKGAEWPRFEPTPSLDSALMHYKLSCQGSPLSNACLWLLKLTTVQD